MRLPLKIQRTWGAAMGILALSVTASAGEPAPIPLPTPTAEPTPTPSIPKRVVPKPARLKSKALKPATSVIQILRDPHHLGDQIDVSVQSSGQPKNGNLANSWVYTHAWSATLNASLTLPLIWVDGKSAPKAKVPRTGGGIYNRILIDSGARLMGNAFSYLDLDFMMGLPYQSDPALRNSLISSWVFGGSLLAHVGFGAFAFEVGASDAASFASSIENAAGKSDYRDRSNFLVAHAALFYFPGSRWDIRASYSETPQYVVDTGTDTPAASYLLGTAHNGRARAIAGGIEIVLNRDHCFLGLDASYLIAADDPRLHNQTWSGKVRWLF